MNRFAVAAIAGLLLCGTTLEAQFRLPMKLEELERRARADSNDPAAHFNVALAYWNAKRWQDADKSLRTAIMLDPRFAPAYVALNFLPYAQHSTLWDEISENRVPDEWKPRLEEADQFFRHAYMIDPFVELRSGNVVRPNSAPYLEAMEMFFGEYIRDYWDGLDQYFAGKYQESYDRLQRVLNATDGDRHPERLPTTVFWWHGLAAAHVEKWDEAIVDFDLLLDRSLEPTRSDSLVHFPLRTNEYRYIMGYLKQRSGKVNEAIDLYREALTNDIGLYMAHVRLAEMYENAQMWPQAIASRRNAVNANPDDESLVLDLAKTLVNAGKQQEAVSAFKQAISMNPRDPRPQLFLGLVLEQLGQKDEARTALTQFTVLAPSRYDRQIAIAKQHLDALK